jgi:lipopolysaccharide/colanic/teichoic acid biosynthesis glycosyltransferase
MQQIMSAFRPSRFERLAYSSGGLSLGPISFRHPSGTEPPRDATLKRMADVILALTFLAMAGFPMLLVAVVVRLTSKGPALFRQQRIGLNGHRFTMLKFRTMRDIPEPKGSCRQATCRDARVTQFGAWLRRTSIDELPQLLNVLEGSMSVVGPRPHAPGTCAAGRPFESITLRYADRHCVKPGMTGLAQVRGWRGETDTEEKLLRRIDSDLEYIANRSLGSDMLIICRTIVTVLRMLNAY